MSEREWIVGDAGVVSLTVADPAGTPTDPAALRLKVKAPGADAVTYTYGAGAEIVRDGVGAFHCNLVFGTAGNWAWRWESDTPNGNIEGDVSIRRSAVV